MKREYHKGNKTSRETYSRLIGCNFGSDEDGNDRIFNGGYWDEYTNKKQYEFIYVDKSGNFITSLIVDYKGFKEIINGYVLP